MSEKIDTNSPLSEGILAAHRQVMDAFDASKIESLTAALREALGPEVKEATVEPDKNNEFRGGPYLLGGLHRRAWPIRWENLPPTMRKHMDANDLERVKAHPSEMILQWADLLPFAIIVIRAPPQPDSGWVGYAAEGLLDALPGRLGPDNRIPRAESQLIIYAKISEERMERLREAMGKKGPDDRLRRDLAKGLGYLGNAPGPIHLESLASNVLHVEGEGSSILGDDQGPAGPFRAFVFSNGNLVPHEGWGWHLPTWIPPGPGSSSWTDFNFHPFLNGAIRSARHVWIEAGVLDEALSRATKGLLDRTKPGAKVALLLHPELTRLHAELQALATWLHLGSTRSPIAAATEDGWPEKIRYDVKDDSGWPQLGANAASSEALKAAKAQAEQDARQVLDGLERRLDRALDLVTAVENRRLNRSMRFWTILAAFLAFAAIVVAAFLR